MGDDMFIFDKSPTTDYYLLLLIKEELNIDLKLKVR